MVIENLEELTSPRPASHIRPLEIEGKGITDGPFETFQQNGWSEEEKEDSNLKEFKKRYIACHKGL